MMTIPYYYQKDVEYAHKRLSSTFVKTTDGRLMFVTGINLSPEDNKKHVAIGIKIGPKDELKTDSPNWGLPCITVPVSELDMSPIDLGYIFSKRLQKGVFVARYPMRSIFKQGLHTNALQFSEGSRDHLVPDELLSPMLNVYPTLKAAKNIAAKKITVVPFSRAFAVRGDGDIEYMGRQVVGSVIDNGEKVVAVLSPKHSFLQQHLDWSLK